MPEDQVHAYNRIILKIFKEKWSPGVTEFPFTREDILDARNAVAPELVRLNAGDVKYSFTYRNQLPDEILKTEAPGKHWVIFGAGKSKYVFRQVASTRILPNPSLVAIPIPDSTPEIIRSYALNDEQALLAIVRYNRLLDIFLGITTYSLQNHLRTSVKGIGQIEIDELYVGIDSRGQHYMIPVQAKGGKDEIGIVQVTQDIGYVSERFPTMRCKAVAAQFMPDQTIALFSLVIQNDDLRIVEERHYKLLPHREIDRALVTTY